MFICSQVPRWKSLLSKRPNCLKPEGEPSKNFHFLKFLHISTNINLQKPGIATPSESYRKRNKLDYPVNVARSASSIINGHHQECGMTMIKMMIITINCHQNDHHWQERGKTNCSHSLCLPLRHWALSEVGRITLVYDDNDKDNDNTVCE